MISFLKFMELEEELHPELEDVLKSDKAVGKQVRVEKKIKELTKSGQDTGVANNKLAKGSSRLYVKSNEPEKITVDGKPTDVPYGIKTVIRNSLDRYMGKGRYSHNTLGHLQNAFENGDSHINREHRVLVKNDDGTYSHNPHGIFPPLLDHDEKNHNWSKVGHSDDITNDKFRELTKNEDYPKGITHRDFHDALIRDHEINNGRYYINAEYKDPHLDRVSNHPLVREFMDYHRTYNAPPHDLGLNNMGVFSHNGKDHIVARDHGFSNEARDAYADTRKRKLKALGLV